MAIRKDDLYDSYHKGKHTMKRSRITIDVSPELRKRIKKAASEQDISISKFLTRIIEEAVLEESVISREQHPATRRMYDELMEVRDQILQDRGGKPFENIDEMIPEEKTSTTQQEEYRPLTPEFLERIHRVRERIIKESKGQGFEDSAEAVRRMRDERTKYLEELREQS
jgi:uncharacterized protein (DUF1778 family)